MNQIDKQIVPKGPISLALFNSKNFVRFICLILILSLLIILLFEYFFWRFHNINSKFKLSFTPNGATIIISPDDQLRALFILPASSRWTNTGLKLKPGKTLRITASGKIHTAFHRLVECAINDTKPQYKWLDPNGEAWSNLGKLDVLRRNLLIMPKANIGALLGYLHIPGTPEPTIFNSKPEGIILIGKEGYITNKTNMETELWVVINDVILDPNNFEKSKEAYIGSGNIEIWSKRWDYIVDNDYWDLWWDDNIGHFFLQIEKVEEDKALELDEKK
ncbi:MAG: hypothetical protein ACFFDN_42465 [Candidatus Hodarchaeota archaeon]